MNANLVNMIFGMKVRQAGLEAGLNLSEFAARCDLSPSYVTEIEKGRKYPKTDKIMKMAGVLGKNYDDWFPSKWPPRWPTWKPCSRPRYYANSPLRSLTWKWPT